MLKKIRLTHYRPAMHFRKQKILFEDFSSSVFLQYKKYHPLETWKFNNLGISPSLKLRILVEKSFQYLLS